MQLVSLAFKAENGLELEGLCKDFKKKYISGTVCT